MSTLRQAQEERNVPPCRDRGLFTNAHPPLGEIFREVEGFAKSSQRLGAALPCLRAVYATHMPSTGRKEGYESRVHTVLRALGWRWEVGKEVAGSSLRPDYLLFADRETEEQCRGRESGPRSPEPQALVVLASPTGESSGLAGPVGACAVYLLCRSAARWAIVTNGRLWRLYERSRSRASGGYYEVDLQQLLERDTAEEFSYFYCFFSSEALAGRNGTCPLDRLFEADARHKARLCKAVRKGAYDALRALINGFLAHPKNELNPHDEAHLRAAHESALALLFRMLFVICAEAAGILPRAPGAAGSLSLGELVREVCDKLRRGARLSARACTYWPKLRRLFCSLRIPWLEAKAQPAATRRSSWATAQRGHRAERRASGQAQRWRITDAPLAQAMYALAFGSACEDRQPDERLDYGALGLEQLATICEELLQLRPQIALQTMIERPGRRGAWPTVAPADELSAPKRRSGRTRRFAPGEIYLTADRGGRKASGSFFTPEYVVNYIVEQTLGPLLDRAAEKTAQLRKQIAKLERERKRALSASEAATLRRAKAQLEARLLEPYLSLKVLDPAMGSGRFLLAAADLIALAMAADPSLPAIPRGEAGDSRERYKRLVASRCLFGVDKNPLAVELARLTLWLYGARAGHAPASLRQHLRCGNSLLGASVEEHLAQGPPPAFSPARRAAHRRNEKQQAPQRSIPFAEIVRRGRMGELCARLAKAGRALPSGAQAEARYAALLAEVDAACAPAREVANLSLAPFFGAEVDGEAYREAVKALRAGPRSACWRRLAQQSWFRQAQAIAARQGFFHWELEFPEAFFGEHGLRPKHTRGFDAVVGNPPWVSYYGRGSQRPDEGTVRCLKALAGGKCGGRINEFLLFLLLCLKLRRRGGRYGMIVPDTFAINESYEATRQALLAEGQLELCALQSFRVFPDAHVHTCVVVGGGGKDVTAIVHRRAEEIAHGQAQGERWPRADVLARAFATIPFYSRCVEALLKHISAQPTMPLGALAEVVDGINTGSAAFRKRVLSRHGPAGDTPRRCLEGQGIAPYEVRWTGLWIDANPRLFSRSDTGGASLGRPDIYCRPKLVSRQTARYPIVGYDSEGLFPLNSVHSIALRNETSEDAMYLLALLNSRCLRAYYLWSTQETRALFPQVHIAQLQRLPIRRIDFAHRTSPAEKKLLLRQCLQALERGDYETPLELARLALRAHAAFYGPGGRLGLEKHACRPRKLNATATFPGREDFVHDLVALLAWRLVDLRNGKHGERERALAHSMCGIVVNTLPWETGSNVVSRAATIVQTSNRPHANSHHNTAIVCLDKNAGRTAASSYAKTHDDKGQTAIQGLLDSIVCALYCLEEEQMCTLDEAGV